MRFEYLKSNYFDIKSSIKNEKVKLIAVSKTFPVEMINYLSSLGHLDFGESKAQELIKKYDETEENKIKWHFIGNIQTNKLKYIVPKCEYIHSVYREKEMSIIDEISFKLNKIQKIFIEINISMEKSKSGISEEAIENFLESSVKFKNIKVVGFMTMAPFFDNSEETRAFFKKMKIIQRKYLSKYNTLTELSMGMSNDYLIAIEEGATMVRVGSLIFGKRYYQK